LKAAVATRKFIEAADTVFGSLGKQEAHSRQESDYQSGTEPEII
jgi:hypothetical protein